MRAQIVETELVTKRRWHGSIREAWGGQCAYCGATAQSLDHVIPRSQGGPTVRENCVPACLACNGSKGSREVLSWWRLRPGWSALREQQLLEWLAGNNNGGNEKGAPKGPFP
jgi:5-methylcytosine-specific restriction endonuclease McrA